MIDNANAMLNFYKYSIIKFAHIIKKRQTQMANFLFDN